MRRTRRERTIETAGLDVQEAAVRLRSRRRNLVVWSSSAAPPGVTWYDPPRYRRRARSRWVRTGALLAVLGLLRLGRVARIRWRGLIALAGWALTVSGVLASSASVLISGLGVLLFTLLLPSKPDTASAYNSCWPRLWAEPCTPLRTRRDGPGRR